MKRNVRRKPIELKKEIVAKHETGMRVTGIATHFKLVKSTVCTILKNKDAIKAAEQGVARGVNVLTKQRSHIIEKVVKLLLIWINRKQLAGDSVSGLMIHKNASQLHKDLVQETSRKK